MPAAPDTLYITVEEYRDHSKIKPIITRFEDVDVEDYIVEAMMLIDGYIGTAWNRDSSDQEFIFPRDIDTEDLEAPYIPRGIETACRMICDVIIKKDMGAVSAHEIQSETNAGHSYTKVQGNRPERGFEDIPPRALGILSQYAENGMYFAIGRP